MTVAHASRRRPPNLPGLEPLDVVYEAPGLPAWGLRGGWRPPTAVISASRPCSLRQLRRFPRRRGRPRPRVPFFRLDHQPTRAGRPLRNGAPTGPGGRRADRGAAGYPQPTAGPPATSGRNEPRSPPCSAGASAGRPSPNWSWSAPGATSRLSTRPSKLVPWWPRRPSAPGASKAFSPAGAPSWPWGRAGAQPGRRARRPLRPGPPLRPHRGPPGVARSPRRRGPARRAFPHHFSSIGWTPKHAPSGPGGRRRAPALLPRAHRAAQRPAARLVPVPAVQAAPDDWPRPRKLREVTTRSARLPVGDIPADQ